MNDFSGRMANLPADKRALLETLLTEKRSAAVIPRVPRSGQTQAFPASFAQQRLWFLDQWQPNSPVYNVGMAYRLEGALDIVLLERCAQEIVARHESLHTSFSIEDEEPVQVIHPSVKLSLALTDLSGLPEDQRAARKLAFEEVQAPFDLTRAPLLRIKVLCLNEDEHVLLLTMHHIVSDGWSMAVVCRELEQLYRAHRTGLASPLPELPIQYAD